MRKCPYAGAIFPVKMEFPDTYPFQAPRLYFNPGQMFHPNVDAASGVVCGLDIDKMWGPTKNVTDLAKFLLNFLNAPSLESPLNADAAAALDSNLAGFEEQARKAAATAPKKA